MRCFFHLIVASFAALLLLATPAAAQTSETKSFKVAVTQVDGITSEVVDKLWSGTDEYWHHGDYYRIVSILRVCVEADPGFTDAYGSGSWLLWSLGDMAGADRLLKYGTARRPDLWDLEYEFGWHLYNTKRYAAALPYLKRATTNAKASAVAWKTLAHCYDRLGRTQESAATWRAVVQKFPRDAAAPSNLRRVEAKLP
ncbi:MAG: hypothetical protein H7Z41_09910 [Cytophagales bacterium]|nr:hypothetical protein [Armatimonadota bacterium]